MRTLVLSMGVLAVAFVGCGKESPRGGDTETEEGSFSLVVPRVTTIVKQAEQDDVTISIDRGENFKPDVTVKLEAPAGITATPDTFTFKAGSDEQEVTLQAAADASVGKQAVKVTGDPTEGETTTTSFEIEVAERDADTSTQ